MKTGFIGAGSMGAAIIEALLSRGGVSAPEIWFFDANRGRNEYLQERFGVKAAPGGLCLARETDIIVVAVKPPDVRAVLDEIRGALSPSKLLISIAAGVTTASLEKFAGTGIPVVRAMPSMAASSGRGITVICAGKHALEEHLEKAERLFSAAGGVFRAEEKMMDAATAVGGSGPAYLFYFAESLEKAAREEGFGPDDAAKLARATVCGAAAVLESTGTAPAELRRMVATPGGTTEAAMRILEDGLCELVIKAVAEARARAAEISGQISNTE